MRAPETRVLRALVDGDGCVGPEPAARSQADRCAAATRACEG